MFSYCRGNLLYSYTGSTKLNTAFLYIRTGNIHFQHIYVGIG